MRANLTIALALAALAAVSASPAFAQTAPREPNPDKVRVRIGPLWLNPTLALTNAGVDTNVFNQADDENPKRDFTLTITPATDLWLRMGRTWLASTIQEDIVWYKKYAGERSGNKKYRLGWIVPLTRISFGSAVDWVNTRERPGYEIDARSQHSELGYSGTLELRALSKTLIGVHAERRRIDFRHDAVFLGSNLRDELNRTSTNAGLTLRHELTPLTSLMLDASRSQDRFDFAPTRDADSNQASVSLRFDAAALIRGTATVGVRDYKPLDAGVPDYRGVTSAVDLAYVVGESTRLGVTLKRNIDYSFDSAQPYYLETGIEGSLAQQIFGPVDVVARVGSHRLSFRNREGVVAPALDRADLVQTYGGGVGYHMGRDVRLGVNVDRARRESKIDRRQYNGLRYGIAVTYGR